MNTRPNSGLERAGWFLVSAGSGEPLVVGETYYTAGEIPVVLEGGTPPREEEDLGRIWTDTGRYYPTIIGAAWVQKETET